jgi:plasmid maintenance system antidote protein VapI
MEPTKVNDPNTLITTKGVHLSCQAPTASQADGPAPAPKAVKPRARDTRSFTSAENEKLRAVLARLVERVGTQAALAGLLDILQPSLSNVLLGKSGIGRPLAIRVAALVGTDLETLLHAKAPEKFVPSEIAHADRPTSRRKHAVRTHSFTEDQNAKLRVVAQRLVERLGSQALLAEHLGVMQPSLSNLLLGKSGFGPRPAMLLAELEGTDLRTLFEKTALPQPLVRLSPRSRERYPNRAIVLDCAPRLGFSEGAIERLRALRLTNADDAPPLWWLGQLTRFEQEGPTAPHAIEAGPRGENR